MIDYPVTINGISVTASYSEQAVDEIFLPLLRKLTGIQKKKGRRILVMLAAPPGAGKSTLLSFLEHLTNEHADLGNIQTIGMDGFHKRQEYLVSHTVQRDGKEIPMVKIKGAPVTFDLKHLTESVKKVADGEVCGWTAIDSADVILAKGQGNYLLLDMAGWSDLKSYADYTISVSAEENCLRERLIDRRIKTGVAPEAATQFVDFSDMPNVRLCLQKTVAADLQLRIDSTGDYHIVSGGLDEGY